MDRRREERAVLCDGFPRWNAGAPCPHLIQSTRQAILVYLAYERDPNWDGTYARIVDVADEAPELVAIVRFERVASTRMGTPNDETLHGHPLHGKGLEMYGAHRVEGSRWLAELRAIDAVHPQHIARTWEESHHYLLAFHDNVFECIARSFAAEVIRTTMASACRAALEEVMRTR